MMEGTTRLDPSAALKQKFGLQERASFAHLGLSFVNLKVFHTPRNSRAHSRAAPRNAERKPEKRVLTDPLELPMIDQRCGGIDADLRCRAVASSARVEGRSANVWDNHNI
jgi:hypothetical protein